MRDLTRAHLHPPPALGVIYPLLTPWVKLPPCVPTHHTPTPGTRLCLCTSLCLSLHLCTSCLYLPISAPPCLYLPISDLPVSISLSLHLPASISPSLHLPVSISPSLSGSVSVSCLLLSPLSLSPSSCPMSLPSLAPRRTLPPAQAPLPVIVPLRGRWWSACPSHSCGY